MNDGSSGLLEVIVIKGYQRSVQNWAVTLHLNLPNVDYIVADHSRRLDGWVVVPNGTLLVACAAKTHHLAE